MTLAHPQEIRKCQRATPSHATPRHATPRHATRRHVKPRHPTQHHSPPSKSQRRQRSPAAHGSPAVDRSDSACMRAAPSRPYTYACGRSHRSAGFGHTADAPIMYVRRPLHSSAVCRRSAACTTPGRIALGTAGCVGAPDRLTGCWGGWVWEMLGTTSALTRPCFATGLVPRLKYSSPLPVQLQEG